MSRWLAAGVAVVALAVCARPANAAPALEPVLSGLTAPVYVTGAGDGTHRLFVVERPGIIRVLLPGSASPTIFLDISSRVVSGGEQGLLGLAFHPFFRNTRRLFVSYTRAADGALQVAEYRVSANPGVADPASEIILLTVPHPTFTNHNGGMLAFGPDGYLYVGTGDGGSANDPPDNAQNIDVLLGKLLRIDVDHPTPTTPYSSPASNPFSGSAPGRDEVYALGLRNPWRFSFDRLDARLIVGDVGQNLWEEIDVVTAGGNYGWRVFEGMHCTGNDPGVCSAPDPCNISGFSCPISEYGHTGGRCSITGGYAYRGPIGTLTAGTYIFADFCTGEIFTLSGSAPVLLLDTTRNIASFGEDDAGEQYVVGLGGTVDRLVTPGAPCAFAPAPLVMTSSAAGGNETVSVAATTGCAWSATSSAPWISLGSAGGTGSGAVSVSIAANSGERRTETVTVAGQTVTVRQGSAFADVTVTHPYHDFIGRISAAGFTSGCAPGRFCPDDEVTREQAALMIERALGVTSPPPPTAQTFDDVGPDMFSWPFIEDFVARGITAGCSATPRLFCPSQPITREQVAVFIERALGVMSPPVPLVQRFADVDPGRFAYSYIDDLARRGITAGCRAAPLAFCPDRTLTRGEFAVFIVRAFGL